MKGVVEILQCVSGVGLIALDVLIGKEFKNSLDAKLREFLSGLRRKIVGIGYVTEFSNIMKLALLMVFLLVCLSDLAVNTVLGFLSYLPHYMIMLFGVAIVFFYLAVIFFVVSQIELFLNFIFISIPAFIAERCEKGFLYSMFALFSAFLLFVQLLQ